ncbi:MULTISPECIES: GPW/gp25 family protein [Alphaproteobacteria]|uniref:GPW/gp25 family protein n=1 Tax=Alphaproteobacteria TaxID=28211 RepID=UPI003267DBCF
MAGIDRTTFKVIDNLSSTLQSVEVILSTRIASRVMRREFGGGTVELLGRAITPALLTAFVQLVGVAIDLWEPRLNVRRISLSGTIDEVRAGKAGFVFEADYRPKGHLGDLTVERVLSFSYNFTTGGAAVL